MLGDGPFAGQKIERKDFDMAVSAYYKLMGWDKEGIPSKEKLEELNLAWLNEYLEGRNKKCL